eukprot:353033-Chlamydomonas_euryale.AAC.10
MALVGVQHVAGRGGTALEVPRRTVVVRSPCDRKRPARLAACIFVTAADVDVLTVRAGRDGAGGAFRAAFSSAPALQRRCPALHRRPRRRCCACVAARGVLCHEVKTTACGFIVGPLRCRKAGEHLEGRRLVNALVLVGCRPI